MPFNRVFPSQFFQTIDNFLKQSLSDTQESKFSRKFSYRLFFVSYFHISHFSHWYLYKQFSIHPKTLTSREKKKMGVSLHFSPEHFSAEAVPGAVGRVCTETIQSNQHTSPITVATERISLINSLLFGGDFAQISLPKSRPSCCWKTRHSYSFDFSSFSPESICEFDTLSGRHA